MLQRIKERAKNVLQKINSKAVTAGATAFIAGNALISGPASAAPATSNASLNTVLESLGEGFTDADLGFTYLALAAVPVTIFVVLFFWLRGKFKQAVSGA